MLAGTSVSSLHAKYEQQLVSWLSRMPKPPSSGNPSRDDEAIAAQEALKELTLEAALCTSHVARPQNMDESIYVDQHECILMFC